MKAREDARGRLGRYGEELAARHLGALGMAVLDRNWHCAEGEIDLVALDGRCLVVVEVKTRSSVAFGEPVEAVTHRKAARLRRLAAAYLAAHRDGLGGVDAVRVDVVGVLRVPGERTALRHVRGVGS